MVRPENIRSTNSIRIDQAIFRNMYVQCEKEAKNLKENRERYMEGLEERKAKENCNYSKLKNKI